MLIEQGFLIECTRFKEVTPNDIRIKKPVDEVGVLDQRAKMSLDLGPGVPP